MNHAINVFVALLPAIVVAVAACIAMWRDYPGTAICLAVLCLLMSSGVKVTTE